MLAAYDVSLFNCLQNGVLLGQIFLEIHLLFLSDFFNIDLKVCKIFRMLGNELFRIFYALLRFPALLINELLLLQSGAFLLGKLHQNLFDFIFKAI